MSNLEPILSFAGIEMPKEVRAKDCSLWTGEFFSPSGKMSVSILQIRSFTSFEQIRRDLDFLKSKTQSVIISTKQGGVKLHQFLLDHSFTLIQSEPDYLFNFSERSLGAREIDHSGQTFVEPTIKRIRTDKVGIGKLIFSNWINNTDNNNSPRIAAILAPAGFGKTTFARHLEKILGSWFSNRKIPILISRHDWHDLISRGEINQGQQITLKNIVYRSFLRTFKTSKIGADNIDLLISKGILVPIFDGLDELCSDLLEVHSISDVIRQLKDILSDDNEGTVIVTSRTLYWTDNVSPHLSNEFEHFRIMPFDSVQKSELIKNQLGSDPILNRKANLLLQRVERIASLSDEQVTESNKLESKVKFSMSPYIIYLASVAAKHAPEKAYSDDLLMNAHDPLDGIMDCLFNRDIDKVGIAKSIQSRIILSASLLYGDSFSITQIEDIYDLFDVKKTIWPTMNSHHIFIQQGDRRGFLFQGLSDYLRAKAIALWLYTNESNLIGIDEYFMQIRSESESSIDIFCDISRFYLSDESLDVKFAKPHVKNQISRSGLQGLLLLYGKAKRVVESATSSEISTSLLKVFLSNRPTIYSQNFEGEIFGLEFFEFLFEKCTFKNVIFRNCKFDKGTTFFECNFIGNFSCESSSTFGLVKIERSKSISAQAKSVFSKQKIHGASRRIEEDDVIDIIKYILNQFRMGGGYQFCNISREGVLSRARQRNSYIADDTMEILEKNNVINIAHGQNRNSFRARVMITDVVSALQLLQDGIIDGNIKECKNHLLSKFN